MSSATVLPPALELRDESHRVIVRTMLDKTVFVEAGAGSGKTRELVERICALVDSGVELRGIAAITFTEKAAGELRERVRKRLAATAESNEARENTGALRAAALNQLDTAPIGTIHSFAARLISENPVAAGVPPMIDVVDELRSQIAFTKRWEAAVAALFNEPRADKALRVLLAVGVTLDNLRDLGRALDSNWDRLEDSPSETRYIPELNAGPIIRQCSDVLALREHCTNPNNVLLAKGLSGLEAWLLQLQEAQSADDPNILMGVLRKVPTAHLKGGAKGDWQIPVDQVRSAAQDVVANVAELIASIVGPALDTVTSIMSGIFLDEAGKRQRRGELEYHDLLVHARNLLVGEERREIQAAVHRRYHHVMLDEFQDTDPIQAEIALRICSHEVCGPNGWEKLPIPAGRLFTVGDPKQSIYRFRRADIATYMTARGRAGADTAAEVARLNTNFRSTPAVLRWVNHTFAQLIEANGSIQADYQPLHADPSRPEVDDSTGPAVAVIGRSGMMPGADGEKPSAQARHAQEAADVAAAIGLALGHGGTPWQKQSGAPCYALSNLESRDICILLPARTSLSHIEHALDSAGIEYRAEASSLVYGTQEVHDLLLLLRSLANSADQASLALALRTPYLGCGDDDLYEWHAGGGYWSIHGTAQEALAGSPVARALSYLKTLSWDLSYIPPSEIMERILADRRVLESATDSPRYRDVWRRLRFVVDQARAWSEATHGSLRDYLFWAAVQQDENAKVKEAVVPETDAQAVRIMTIHAAKGLEFPMVVLAGAGSTRGASSDKALWDASGQLQVHLSGDIESAGYAEAKDAEAELLAAEKRRLLYVACTRATSHLVVSLYSGGPSSLSGLLGSVDDPETVPELQFPDDFPLRSEKTRLEVSPVPAFEEWLRMRARWVEQSMIPASTSVTALTKGGPLPATGSTGTPEDSVPELSFADDFAGSPFASGAVGMHGADFGTALHRLMEVSGLQADDGFGGLARTVALQFWLEAAADLEACARSAMSAVPVRRAAERRHWNELPVAVERDGVVIEGIIDLLYREDDGSLVIIDFKTDVQMSEATQSAYWQQLSLYAELLAETTGERVSELVLVLCRPSFADVRRQKLENLSVPVS
ncbi:exodeoxyribonuclease V subunit beta [Arthrobacter sp. PAMC25284]|uniref:UvrD-helicase domain-containing protein n=1 Tax=Arthrobacter sp. PAMC25284 TaxID=2861279 RepID=UPI001C634CB5|nr:UvrD-helicase domain-containing protein [Arthrobacter sp. PAMC25284]QYF91086.1 UvrD-helicase domain-containing protein [Arthrobacter sp. PAMC25284]